MSYGAIGQFSCLYYNIYVAASVTMQGRSCISAAGLMFEAFLADNVKFESLNEIIEFIHNIVNEKDERMFNDNDIIDEDININECFYKVMSDSGFNYIPDEEDCKIVYDILCNLTQEDINRIYYKNNLYSFMENKCMKKCIINILTSMDLPYLDPRTNKVPEYLKPKLDVFCDLLKEYVYYHYQYIDRLDRYHQMIRSVCVITDTDSTIISLDPWYRYILELVKDIPMNIKHQKLDIFKSINIDEFGDAELINPFEYIEEPTEYSYYDDKVIELQSSINPFEIIPQEGLRYSIINVMAYVLTILINDYMERYTKNSNSWSEDKKCLIYMKNEYLFKKILLTSANKFYASIQELQEGRIIKGGLLDIKGLPMAKTTLNRESRKRLKEILYEEIMNTIEINPVNVLKKLSIFEKEIYNSLNSGCKDYYKPLKINSMKHYKDPMQQQGIKASVVWNNVREGDMTVLDLDVPNSIDIVKVDINLKNINKIKDEYPTIYSKLYKMLSEDEFFKKGITSIAIPRDEEVPEWVKHFINYTNIISDSVKDFPLESVGIFRGVENNTVSNILSL